MSSPESDWRKVAHGEVDSAFTLSKSEVQSFIQGCVKKMEARPLNQSEKYTLHIEVVGFKILTLRVWEHSGLSGKTLIKRRTIHLWR